MNNNIIFLLALFSFLTLSACSSMLTIGTAAFVTTTWYDSRTIGSQIDDNILKIHIYHALQKNKQIKQSTRIINTVYQGNILLTGQSPSTELSNQAIQIVMHIDGVKKIYNAIRQSQPISLQNILLDCLISSQIRFNLFTQKNVHINNIKVISENREIFLLGKLTLEERIYAEKVAKNIRGVKNVFTTCINNT
ncbi:possible lipoprotein [Candidatus Blochmanniella floridana]|uniref:Possible lipoprotein n=1 Tax=Blochmanniella floridana TaxID=203907 RepID=Q7VQR5_BLOFL|nr:possible lipoprotein [Candidatus Blochmannia floridanus]